jgi:hypothetical protein
MSLWLFGNKSKPKTQIKSQIPKLKTQNSKLKSQSSMRPMTFWDLGFGIWDLIWDLGFGIWVLGFDWGFNVFVTFAR